jgi:hypothetical protein
VTVASVITRRANVICARETEARAHSKRSRSNPSHRLAERGAVAIGRARQASSPRSLIRIVAHERAAKSVATEYYRPNIEDCGGCARCLK